MSYFVCKTKKDILYLHSAIGEILKRPTRADCKSADYVFVGSNPTLPTKTQTLFGFFYGLKMDFSSYYFEYLVHKI